MAKIKSIQLSIGITEHPKIVKLMNILGDRAFFNVVSLWIHVAQHYPTGRLKNVSADDLEVMAKWSGKKGEFIRAATELKLIDPDKRNKGYFVHGWWDYQGWIKRKSEREQQAKKAAEARWKGRARPKKTSGQKRKPLTDEDMAELTK